MQENNLFADILTTVTRYLKVLVIIVVAGICLSGIRVVESGNVALILRFGKLVGDSYEEQVHDSGLLLAFPYIIDEVIIVPTSSVMEQSVTTHYTEGNYTDRDQYVITGDQNIATMSASVKYMVSDPVAYALNVSDVSAVINACVSSAMLSEAAGCDVDELLTSGKDQFTANAKRRAMEKLEKADVGVTLSTLELTKVSMPPEVKGVYDEVNAATVQAATIKENALSIRNSMVPYAQSEAAEKIATANAEKVMEVGDATLALTEFWGLLEEYQANPQVVKARVYQDKVAQMIATIGKIRVVRDGQTNIILNP